MFSVEISFSLFQPRQEKISGGETLIKINESTQELRARVKLTHEIIECDSCNINKVKRRKKVIETSQSDLIWLDHFCTISSKKSQENWPRDSLYYLGYSYLLFLCYDSAESVEIKKKNRKKNMQKPNPGKRRIWEQTPKVRLGRKRKAGGIQDERQIAEEDRGNQSHLKESFLFVVQVMSKLNHVCKVCGCRGLTGKVPPYSWRCSAICNNEIH